MNKQFLKKIGALSTAALLAASGILLTASSASATPFNIDPDAKGSITIAPLERPAVEGPDIDGTPQDTTGYTPMPNGAEFQVSLVSQIGTTVLDLTDSETWDFLAPYIDGTTPFDPAEATFTMSAVEETSGANNNVVFDNLDIGLYYVTQLNAGSTPVNSLMAPFLVTIPMPLEGEPGSWLYDVNVYPKNAPLNSSKTVDNSSATGLGTPVRWTINGEVPILEAGETIRSFAIEDTMPAGLVITLPQAPLVTLESALAVDVPLTMDDDYDVTISATGLEVIFTTDGLVKLTANPGGVVSVNFATVVTAIGTGTIVNSAEVTVNGNSSTVIAQTTWGALNIRKHVAGDETRALEGAEFEIYTTQANAIAGTNKVAVANETLFVVGTNGVATVDGLYAETGGTQYWVKEVKAPAGYVLSATPIAVTVTPGATADATVLQVPNAQSVGPVLPKLGSSGMIILTAIGGLALAGGTALVISSRRKASATN